MKIHDIEIINKNPHAIMIDVPVSEDLGKMYTIDPDPELMGMVPTDEEATKGAQQAEQSLAERVKALKEARNTILRQMERKEIEHQLKARKEQQ